jgi:acetylornithine deacetylase/succinyl-diaminopimelate desuccinylase-like protein
MARSRVPALLSVCGSRFAGVLAFLTMMTFACTAPVRAQSTTPPPYGPGAQAPATANPSLSAIEIEAISWLQGFMRINTTNPPGNELVAAKYLADILQKNGIQSEIFESTPGRGILVARLAASAVTDPSRALLLMGHLDVVGVDKTKWTVDPFGAVLKDGYIYGRGAIDDKSMTIANLAVFIAIKRSGMRLTRDIIFLSEGDEEAGGETGMKFAVEKHWDKIAAGYALNEGGHIELKDGKVQFVAIAASEKVPVNVDVIATGTSGHASLPRKDNAVVHLGAAIAKIGSYETPVQFNTVSHAYFEGLAKVEDAETAKWMESLDTADRGEHAARYLSNTNPLWNAMLRDTISPTMLQAGIRVNVIPAEARGAMNIRLLPGNQIEPLLGKLRTLINDPEVRLEVQPGEIETAPSSSLDSELYGSITRVAGQVFPGAAAFPMMDTFATDSARLRLRNVQAYGLLPFPLTPEDEWRMHGEDERIPVTSFQKGIDFLFAIVNDFSVAK